MEEMRRTMVKMNMDQLKTCALLWIGTPTCHTYILLRFPFSHFIS